MADWARRFDEFELHKASEADAAEIAPLVTERDEAAESLLAIGNAWSRAMFGGLFYLSNPPSAELPAMNLVFVQSRDGNTVTSDPSSFGGGEADKHLIYEGLSRVAADAVLAGSRSISHGRVVFSVWRRELVALRAAMSLPRHPAQIVATLHGVDLEGELMFNTPELRTIMLTGPRGAAAMRHALKARPWIESVVMEDANDMRGAFEELRRRGIERISCIGGHTLAAPMLDAGLVQDVYLTTGTKEGGEPDTPLYGKPLLAREMVKKRGTGPDEGVVFQHLTMQPG
jgi:riboflavin biosynthesis pyrimidine reductase